MKSTYSILKSLKLYNKLVKSAQKEHFREFLEFLSRPVRQYTVKKEKKT